MPLKKILRFCISISLILSILSTVGCSNKRGKTTLNILAAASLTEVFADLEKGFEAQHPDIDLQYNFAGTSTLVTQVKEGLDADVFVSANTASTEELIQAGSIETDAAKVFAHNKLVIMVNKTSKVTIKDMEDILQEGVQVVIAEPSQPIGKYTEWMLDAIEEQELFTKDYKKLFLAHVVSMEESVKAVVSKVEMGEADVGIVYATDFTDKNEELVTRIEIPEACNQIATYELATLSGSRHSQMADEFVKYVLSLNGQEELLKYGFMLP